jgi:hypothetical protein
MRAQNPCGKQESFMAELVNVAGWLIDRPPSPAVVACSEGKEIDQILSRMAIFMGPLVASRVNIAATIWAVAAVGWATMAIACYCLRGSLSRGWRRSACRQGPPD